MVTVSKFAIENIIHEKFRSILFIIFFLITTVSVFMTGFFIDNMNAGVKYINKQHLADIMVVPSGYDKSAKEALFKGTACTVSFEKDPVSQIRLLDDVESVSPELYLATLTLDCCTTGGVQVIAIDPGTDFTVGKLLKNNKINSLGVKNVVAGSGVGLSKGDKFDIYGNEFDVIGVLEETGTGYDKSVFISYDAANPITTSKKYKNIFSGEKDLVSTVMVNLKKNADAEKTRRMIEQLNNGDSIKAYTPDSMVSELTEKIGIFKVISNIMNVFVVTVSLAAVFTLVSVNTEKRKNRIGSLLSVGTGKWTIIRIFMTEYVYLFITGFTAGIVLVLIFAYPLYPTIRQVLPVTYKSADAFSLCLTILKTFAVTITMLAVSVFFSFVEILKKEPAQLAEEQV